MFVRKDLPDMFEWKSVSSLLINILDLAKEGLHKRGFGEETFLEPLYVRAEKLLSPAREMLNGFMDGKTLDEYIEEYGRL